MRIALRPEGSDKIPVVIGHLELPSVILDQTSLKKAPVIDLVIFSQVVPREVRIGYLVATADDIAGHLFF